MAIKVNDPVPSAKLITVVMEPGEWYFKADAVWGYVRFPKLSPYTRFDFAEWKSHYGLEEMPEVVNLSTLGYWKNVGKTWNDYTLAYFNPDRKK